jgi:hypothetical protein
MGFARWFWLVLVIACVVWYSTVTVYVAIRGAGDVRGMLRRLGSGDGSND